MGRGRQLPPSKYSVSKPVAGRGPGSVAAAAVSVAAVGTTAPFSSSSSSSLSSKLASTIPRPKDVRTSFNGPSNKPTTNTASSNSHSNGNGNSNLNTIGNETDATAQDKDVRGSSGTSAESSHTIVDRSGSISSTVLESLSSAENTVSIEPANTKIEGTDKTSTVD